MWDGLLVVELAVQLVDQMESLTVDRWAVDWADHLVNWKAAWLVDLEVGTKDVYLAVEWVFVMVAMTASLLVDQLVEISADN